MSFKSINHILSLLEQQAQWQEQPFQLLLRCWADVVGAVVATHAIIVDSARCFAGSNF